MKEIRMHMETGGVHEGRSRSSARKIARMMSSGPIDLFKFVPVVRNRVGGCRRSRSTEGKAGLYGFKLPTSSRKVCVVHEAYWDEIWRDLLGEVTLTRVPMRPELTYG